MKKFLRKIVFFSVLCIVLAFLLDYTISYVLKQSSEYPGEFEVMNDIYDGKANCDIAIYGSSRAWVHFDPKIISDSLNKSVYNFGIDGHGFWLQYLRHLEFLKHNPKPKIIIIATDAYSLEKKEDLYQQNQFLPYMLWNKNIQKYTSSFNGFKTIDYYIPLIRYFGKKSILKSCLLVLFKKNEKYRVKGYKAIDSQWNTDFDKAREQMQSRIVKVDTASVKLFEKFILECKNANIDVVLVCSPEYIEGQRFVSNRKLAIGVYQKIASKHQVTFLDYSDNEICKDKANFYNASHLNNTGSDTFSKIFASDLKNKRTKATLKLN